MSDTRIRANTRFLVLTLIAITWLATDARADPIAVNETFSTMGTVGSTGLTGPPAISFQGVTSGSLETGTPFDLGRFVVNATPPGTSTTYSNTPFELTLTVKSIDESSLPSNGTSIVLDGWLNGTVTNGTPADFHENYNIYVFVPGYGPPFETMFAPFNVGNFTNYLNILSGDGDSPIQAEVNVTVAQTVPEPSSIVLFAFVSSLIFYFRVRPDR